MKCTIAVSSLCLRHQTPSTMDDLRKAHSFYPVWFCPRDPVEVLWHYTLYNEDGFGLSGSFSRIQAKVSSVFSNYGVGKTQLIRNSYIRSEDDFMTDDFTCLWTKSYKNNSIQPLFDYYVNIVDFKHAAWNYLFICTLSVLLDLDKLCHGDNSSLSSFVFTGTKERIEISIPVLLDHFFWNDDVIIYLTLFIHFN